MARSSMSQYLEMANKRDEARKDVETLRCLGKILDDLREFLDIPREVLRDSMDQAIAANQTEPRFLLDMLGVLPDVHYTRISSDSCPLVKVLWDVQETPVWKEFVRRLSESPIQQATLIFTLKGRTTMVLTNKGIVPYPGCYFHKIVSGDPTRNDVYLLPVEQVPMFMHNHQFK